jgi:hypothetical protein
LNIVTLFRSKEKRNSEHKANLTRITILRLLDRTWDLLIQGFSFARRPLLAVLALVARIAGSTACPPAHIH